MIRFLGKGSQGSVLEVVRTSPDNSPQSSAEDLGAASTPAPRPSQRAPHVAIKVVKKPEPFSRAWRHIHREIILMQLLHHRNVIHVQEVLQSARHYYLVMNLANQGELHKYVERHHPLSRSVLSHFLVQLVQAIEYIHMHQIAHRDLKLENILLQGPELTLKITDFGLAQYVGGVNTKTPQTFCGSIHYAAPELLQGVPYDGYKADIWSLA